MHIFTSYLPVAKISDAWSCMLKIAVVRSYVSQTGWKGQWRVCVLVCVCVTAARACHWLFWDAWLAKTGNVKHSQGRYKLRRCARSHPDPCWAKPTALQVCDHLVHASECDPAGTDVDYFTLNCVSADVDVRSMQCADCASVGGSWKSSRQAIRLPSTPRWHAFCSTRSHSPC